MRDLTMIDLEEIQALLDKWYSVLYDQEAGELIPGLAFEGDTITFNEHDEFIHPGDQIVVGKYYLTFRASSNEGD